MRKQTSKQSFILDLYKKNIYSNKEISSLVDCSFSYVEKVIKNYKEESETTEKVRGKPFIHPAKTTLNLAVDIGDRVESTPRLQSLTEAWEDAISCRIGCVSCGIPWSYLRTKKHAESWYYKHNKTHHISNNKGP